MNWAHDADKARQQAFDYIEQYNETSDPQLLLNAVSQFRHSLQLAAYNGSRQGRDLAHIGALLREYFKRQMSSGRWMNRSARVVPQSCGR